jgi:hypothetical protein
MKKPLILIIYFLMPTLLISQRHADNWLFGEKAGVTFRNCDMRVIPESNISTLEGVASYSDHHGNLIFYTDGVNVFNYDHVEIKNGALLKGHHSATQSAIIVRHPVNPDQFYIFTVMAYDIHNPDQSFRYSIVDMSKNDGKGEVIEKNVLISESTTEKLIAARHKNNKDTWIIIHAWESDVFLAYLLTEDGLSKDPVESKVGTVHSGNGERKFGYMKISPDRKRLALAIQLQGIIEIFDFDSQTGKISNPILLQSDQLEDVYGLEFSPNSQVLYAAQRRKYSSLYQFDLRHRNDKLLLGSLIKLGEFVYEYGAIQIAPNGKIYVAMKDTNQLGVIHDPNVQGYGCHYLADGIYLHDGISQLGLPTFLHPYFNLCIEADSILCESDDLHLSCNEINNYEAEIKWVSPIGRELPGREVIFENLRREERGYFKIKINVLETEFIDSVYVNVLPAPETAIIPNGSTIFCEGQELLLDAEPKGSQYRYLWNTGETTDFITVNTTGTYIVTIFNEHDCPASDTIETIVTPNLDVHIHPADTVLLCEGETTPLMASPGGDEFKYLWSTGSTNKNIIVSEEGTYWVYVENEIGCSGTDTVFVDVLENPKPVIKALGPTEFCEGDSLQLHAEPDGSDLEYLWSTDEAEQTITVFDEGDYFLQVTDPFGCRGYDTITVSFIPPPDTKIILEGSTPFCTGDSVRLVASPQEEGYQYLWSTGEITSTIWVNTEGFYELTITNESGCEATDSISLEKFPQSHVEIIANRDTRICKGESVMLSSDFDFPDYSWSNGESVKSITVDEEGLYILTVTDENGCKIRDSIIVEYILPEFSGLEDVDFGKVLTGNQDTYEMELTNIGQEDLLISNAEILINKAEFSVSSSQSLPYLLEIGQSITFTLSFAPVQIQEYLDSLIIEIDSPCYFRLANSIKAIGVGKSIVYIPNVETNIGDPEYIRIIASLNVEGEEAGNISYSAKVRFRKNSIWVDESNNRAYIDKYFDGDDVILTFEDTIELLTSQEIEIANIYSYSMLNDNNTTPLIIEEFEWMNGVLGAETMDGVWKTNAICAESLRTVEPLDFKIMTNPNPVEDISTLIIKPVSNCYALINIYNSQGEAVISKNIDLKEKIINEIDFDLSALSSGLYFYRVFISGNIYTIPLVKIE